MNRTKPAAAARPGVESGDSGRPGGAADADPDAAIVFDDERDGERERMRLLRDIPLKVRVELGRGRMRLKDLIRLGRGSVVELERLAGEPLDIYVNDRVIARGEVLVLDDKLCVRVTEILTPEECLRVRMG